ncbi:hypothetical protein ACFYWP_36965 [Actinacidiphila glaucinigra]|uniref:hypothetical protein n=1 Tax=Actinacidiphila glaucinigra TaxID=235986 RepID=UPI00368045B3
MAEALRGSAVQTLTTVTGFLAQLPGFMEVMTDEFRRAQRTETAVVEIINKYEDINGRLSRAALSAQEVITCHPGRRQRELLELVEERDDKLLSRGAKLRTLYPATNRHDDWNRKWVSFVTERGAQVRTYPGPFPKMVVFDNREALIGIYADGELGAGALHIRHKEIVGFLRAVFELFWERADPWLPGSDARAETAEDQEDGAAGPYTTPETRSILWGLAQGKSQKLVAKEHGMSERTLISRLNKLKERLNIQTLPALMYWYGTSPERLIQD